MTEGTEEVPALTLAPVEMRPILLRRTKDEATSSVPMARGVIVDLRDVLDTNGTVLDTRVAENGGRINLPFEMAHWSGDGSVKHLYVPRFENMRQGPFVQLHPLASAANLVARAVVEFTAGKRSEQSVIGAVGAYWMMAMRTLLGKNGLINSAVFSSRIARSGRAVFLVNGHLSPHEVGIPREMARKMALSDGKYAIVGRDPTIHDGSMEILTVRIHSRNVIEAHPMLCKQLNADCDGDELYVMAIPESTQCSEEALQGMAGFLKEHARWPSYMREANPVDVVDWENLGVEMEQRNAITGSSVTPEDIIDQSPALKAICDRTGKDVAAECLKIAQGISAAELESYLADQNNANLEMKMGLGPIGNLCIRIQTVCGADRDLLRSGAYVSERLQQLLLDGKHTVGTGGVRYAPIEMINLFNRTGVFKAIALDDALGVLRDAGLDEERARPFMAWIWLGYPLLRSAMALKPGMTRTEKLRLLKRCREVDSTERLKGVLARISILHLRSQVQPEEIVRAMAQLSMGVDGIFEKHFPLALSAERAADRTSAAVRKLAMRLVHAREKDQAGVPRLLMNLARERVGAAVSAETPDPTED